VTYQGKPVVHGGVVLIGDGFRPRSGRIDPEGNYRISDVPSGLVRIAVVSPDPEPPSSSALQSMSKVKDKMKQDKLQMAKKVPVDRSKWFVLPKQYESTETSGITTTLQPGDNTFDIELK
jgi:hypothetical protein